ncbi:acid phosphatase [Alteromonas naphthalenivorans]|uniref:acid phosphatase n=2 Tax=Alteromonas naphthalenivorans TaxID=715451 RepID=F5Z927_ALTNA|nr:metallophosphoesterase [Alteromonas naphthalenivorans]AEF03570.1 acid phosphatase [Alteromonas naphthalenivorans]
MANALIKRIIYPIFVKQDLTFKYTSNPKRHTQAFKKWARYKRALIRDKFMRVLLLLFAFLSLTCQGQITSHNYYQQHHINNLEGQDNAFHFLVVGDWGRNGHFYQRDVAKWMDIASYQLDAEFIATTGDNFYDNGVASVEDPYWRTSFEDIYHQPHLFVDWHPVLGNHDYRGNWQAQIDYSKVSRRWDMPAQYYSKTVQLEDDTTALILFIDTNPLNPDYATEAKYQEAYSQGSKKQLVWINTMLSNSNAKWNIVIGHHPLYSSGKRYGTTSAIKNVLEPILHQHGVDAYIAGHEHDLQHNQLPNDSLVHIVSGGGSEVRPVGHYDFTRFAESTGGFVAVSMTNNELGFTFINHKGAVIYRHKVQKLSAGTKGTGNE